MAEFRTAKSRRLRDELDEGLAFLGAFLREPRQVGSVVPSSRFVERRILQLGEVRRARTLVELGSGTGGTTRAILGAMRPDAKLLCLEIDEKLHRLLGRIEDPRLIAHHGSAGELREALAAHGLPGPDVVISGIPFSTLERPLAERILEAIAALLAPGGRFVAYQFTASVERLCTPILGSAHAELEPLNIPPLRIFRWTKRAR
jgi:phospholipid N-methyltransferase